MNEQPTFVCQDCGAPVFDALGEVRERCFPCQWLANLPDSVERAKIRAWLMEVGALDSRGETMNNPQKRRPAPQIARHSVPIPFYWMNETSGRLRPAIEAYLKGAALDDGQIAAIRAYLRQWINAPVWHGPAINDLRAGIDGLVSRQAIHDWLDEAAEAAEAEIDPL